MTGLRARRSSDVDAAIVAWPVVDDFTETLWDDAIVPEPGAVLYFQFAAMNATCGAEGPW